MRLLEVLIVVTIFLTLFFAFFRGIFVSEDVAIRTLKAHGFTDIEVVEKKWLLVGLRGADIHDAAIFVCSAKNPAGNNAVLYICTGWPFKGATIRIR